MPKLRQRTLFEFSDNSSPLKKSSTLKSRRTLIEIASEESDDNPSHIKFERDPPKNGDPNEHDAVEDGPATLHHPSYAQSIQEDASSSASISPFTSPKQMTSRKPSRARRNKRLVVLSDDSESDTQRTMKRRRLVKGKRPESLPDDDEEENLENEVDKDKILNSRLRSRRKKTQFARNLERLQRRRRGEASVSENEESESEGSGSSFTHENRSLQVFEGAHPMVIEEDEEDVSSVDEGHDDFIVQDDDGEVELPTMFSMGTYQDLSHHFKVICQLFVHLAVEKPRKRRAFMDSEMKKTYFSVPLAIVRRKLSGMKDSLVTSSTWRSDFKFRLESLPDFRLEKLEFSMPFCDACHIGGRIATLRGVIGGQGYDRVTFEVLGEDAAKSDGKSDEIEWHLGRFCAARTQLFHLFSHWEYTLYHFLCEEVKCIQEARKNENARVYIPATRGISPPDDPNDADGIMDWLDGRGFINLQWSRIKEMMDRAHRLERGKDAEEDLDLG